MRHRSMSDRGDLGASPSPSLHCRRALVKMNLLQSISCVKMRQDRTLFPTSLSLTSVAILFPKCVHQSGYESGEAFTLPQVVIYQPPGGLLWFPLLVFVASLGLNLLLSISRQGSYTKMLVFFCCCFIIILQFLQFYKTKRCSQL